MRSGAEQNSTSCSHDLFKTQVHELVRVGEQNTQALPVCRHWLNCLSKWQPLSPAKDGALMTSVTNSATSRTTLGISLSISFLLPILDLFLTYSSWRRHRHSRYLYLYNRAAPPCQIWGVEIAIGEEKLIRQLSPADPAGILEIFQVHMTPDQKTFVYGYDRYQSELYIVDGLR
jgi:hypothetical protein